MASYRDSHRPHNYDYHRRLPGHPRGGNLPQFRYRSRWRGFHRFLGQSRLGVFSKEWPASREILWLNEAEKCAGIVECASKLSRNFVSSRFKICYGPGMEPESS
jgi:hypothetical protein